MIAWRSAFVLFGLGVIAADDVAVFTDLDLFDLQLVSPRWRSRRSGTIGAASLSTTLWITLLERSRAQNVFHAQLFER